MILYLTLLIGSFSIALASQTDGNWMPFNNPLSLDVFLVLLPLLAGIFLFAFSDSKDVGLRGHAGEILANTVVLFAILLTVVAGTAEILTLGRKEVRKASTDDSDGLVDELRNLFLADLSGGRNSGDKESVLEPIVSMFSGLRAFYEAPLKVVQELFDFDSWFYFGILACTVYVLAETYRGLLQSSLGESVRGAQDLRNTLRLEARIEKKTTNFFYYPLLVKFLARDYIRDADGLAAWMINAGTIPHRVIRVVKTSVAAVAYILILYLGLDIENPHVLALAWLALPVLASIELAWLKAGALGIGVCSALAFSSLVILYLAIIAQETGQHVLLSSLIFLLFLTLFWLVGTLASGSRRIPRKERLNTERRRMHQRRDTWVLDVYGYGFDIARTPARIVDLLLSPIRNRVAVAMYDKQMTSDLELRRRLIENRPFPGGEGPS